MTEPSEGYEILLDALLDEEDPTPDEKPECLCSLSRVRHGGRPIVVLPIDLGDADLDPGDEVIYRRGGETQTGTLLDPPRLDRAPSSAAAVTGSRQSEVARTAERIAKREAEAFERCREIITNLRLQMRLVHCDVSAQQNKVTFFFSAEHRVDFRELVRELRSRLHMRVELRQIGVRETARESGGIGPCGRELCCGTFLCGFAPVSIKQARVQGLSPNPQKLAGACGRIRCCVAFEADQYAEAREGLPKEGKKIETPAGPGVVKELDILHGRVKVKIADGRWRTFDADEVWRPGDPRPAPKVPEPEARPEIPPDVAPAADRPEPRAGGEAGPAGEKRRSGRRRRRRKKAGEQQQQQQSQRREAGEQKAARDKQPRSQGGGSRRRRGRRRSSDKPRE